MNSAQTARNGGCFTFEFPSDGKSTPEKILDRLGEVRDQQQALIQRLDQLAAAITEAKKRELTQHELIGVSVFASLFCTLLILVLRG